jgi:hypothetical protein
MVKMKLIKYIDSPIGVRIEILYLKDNDNNYIKLPTVFLKPEFLELPLISQRICLYITLNGYAISNGNGKNFYKNDIIKKFGDTNSWRLEKYLSQSKEFLQFKSEKKIVQKVIDDIYVYKSAYKVTIGDFKAGTNSLKECQWSDEKDHYCIKYLRDILEKKCDYTISEDEEKDWVNFLNNNGQVIFLHTAESVGKGRAIETNMIRYFGGIAKKLKSTKVAV